MRQYEVEIITGEVLFKKSSSTNIKGYKESLNDFFRINKDITVIDVTHKEVNNDYYCIITYFREI